MDKFLLLAVMGMLTIFAGFDQIATAQEDLVEQQKNYDLTYDEINGTGTITTTHERISQGGEWYDYLYYEEDEKFYFFSNEIGSLIYDKNTCSYSVYDNGFTGTPILTSVSWIPRIAVDQSDTWNELTELYNSECMLYTVPQNDGSLHLVSIKETRQDITYDVNWIEEVFTQDDTVTVDGITYDVFDGDRWVDEQIDLYGNGTFVTERVLSPDGRFYSWTEQVTKDRPLMMLEQVIRFDLENGIKETIKIHNDNQSFNNHKFGAIQTIHLVDDLEIDGQIISLEDSIGLTFDRQFVLDNSATILGIADSMNYDLDKGIDYISSISIHSDNRVALDYSWASGVTPVGSHMVIDPTLTMQGNIVGGNITFDFSGVDPSYNVQSGTYNGALSSSDISAIQTAINTGGTWTTSVATGTKTIKEVFDSPSNQVWTVPSGVSSIEVKAWGAGGGGRLEGTSSQGGGGGYTGFFTGTSASHGNSRIIAGGGGGGAGGGTWSGGSGGGVEGQHGSDCPWGSAWGGNWAKGCEGGGTHNNWYYGGMGGTQTSGGSGASYGSGGGGGALQGGSGGGGWSYAQSNNGAIGGAGGFAKGTLSVSSGQNYYIVIGGGGDSTGSGANGGGGGQSGGAGGGGGYYGGAGGGSRCCGGMGGGGGGSGYLHSSLTNTHWEIGGSGTQQGVSQSTQDDNRGGVKTDDIDYVTGAGHNMKGGDGGDGLMVITYSGSGQLDELQLTYTIPNPASEPLSLSAGSGQPIQLTWSQPNSDGGKPIIEYEVERALVSHAEQPLPPNDSDDGHVDMTGNSLLYRFDDGKCCVTVPVTIVNTPVFEEDFSPSNSWTQVNSWVSITGGQAQLSGGNNADHRIHTPIGTTLSDTTWAMTYKFKSASVGFGYVPLSSGTDNPDADNEDWIGAYSEYDYGSSSPAIRLAWGDSGGMQTTSLITGLSSNTDYWIKVARESSSQASLTVYTDEAMTTEFGSRTATIPTSITGIDNVLVSSIREGGASSNELWYVDDMKIYDGVTSPTTQSTEQREYMEDFSGNNNDSEPSATLDFESGTVVNKMTNPQLIVKSSDLPDDTDQFTIGAWTHAGRDYLTQHNGAIVNEVAYSEGKVQDYSVDFNGVSTWIDSGTKTLYDPLLDSGGGTLAFWIKFDDIVNGDIIFDNNDMGSTNQYANANDNGISAWIDSNLKLNVDFYNNGSYSSIYTASGLSADTWYHIVIQNTGSGDLKMWVDGSAVTFGNGLTTMPYTAHSNSPSLNLRIGHVNSGTHNADLFNGQIDQWLLYDGTLLSQSQVSQIYNSGDGTSDIPLTNLIVRYDFEHDGQSVVQNTAFDPTIATVLSYENTDGDMISFELEETKARIINHEAGMVTSDSVGSKANMYGGSGTFSGGQTGLIGNAYYAQGGYKFINNDSNNWGLEGSTTGGDWLVNGWIKNSGSHSNNGRVIAEQQNLSGHKLHWYYNGNSMSLCMGQNSDQGSGTTKCSPNLATNTWEMLSLKRDGNTMRWYLNAVEFGSWTIPTGSTYSTFSGGDWCYNTYRCGSGYDGNNYYDEWSFWSRSVSDSELSELYNGGSGKEADTMSNLNGLQVYHDFESLNNVSPAQIAGFVPTNVFEVTGLSMSAVDESHVMWTRDNTGFEFFLDGVSEGSLVSSTDLGTADGEKTLPNYETDFSTNSGWTTTDPSAVEITSNELQYKTVYGNDKYAYYDLGTVSEDDWVLRYEWTSSGSASGDDPAFAFALHDYIGDMNDSGDGLGAWWYFDRNNSWDRVYCAVRDGTTSVQGAGCTSGGDGTSSGTVHQHTSDGTKYFFEITRDGGSDFEVDIRTGSHTGTLVTTLSNPSVASTIDGLRYLTASQYVQGAGKSLVLDNVLFCDGTTNPSATSCDSVGVYYIGQMPDGTQPNSSLDELFVMSTDQGTQASDIYDRGNDKFTNIGTSTTTSFDDNNTVSGNTYYYRVSADNGLIGTWATPVSGVSGMPPDPPSITGIAINNPDPNPLDITLTWQNGLSMGTGNFQNYVVIRSPDATFNTVATVGTPTAQTFTDTVPSAGDWYYKVATQSSHGTSTNSSPANIQTPVEPDPPASVNVTLQDADNNPFDTTITWTQPNSDGGSAVNGFKVYRDSTLLATLGNVLTYSDTVPSTSGTSYLYEVSATNPTGESLTKTSFTHTSPTVPSAVSDLAGQADSDTEATLTWSQPSTGGSAIIRYDIVQDGSIVDNTTNLTYTRTGLTQSSTYAFNVIAVNNVGSSTNSNTVNITTHTPVTGTITGNAITDGATVELTVTPNITGGTPTPSFQTYTIKEGSTVIQTFTGTVYYLQLQDGLAHNYTVESTDSSHWNNPTITGSFSVQADYEPDWKNSLSYNYTRSGGTWQSYVNRADTNNWDIYCTYRTTDEVIAKQAGISSTATGVWAFNETQSIPSTKTVYWECKENANSTDILFTTTSFATDRLGGGILLLDNIFEDWTGTPVALFFILLVAGLFTGRSAPTGILLILAVVGIMGFIGMLSIDEATFGFVLLAGILGIFVGKRFL